MKISALSFGLFPIFLASISPSAMARASVGENDRNMESASLQNDGGNNAESASGSLSDIVVTAQKRAQNVQEIPLAIVAMTGSQLAKTGVVSTDQLNTAIPGLNIRTTTAYFQPSIRGVGTSSLNVENPVALYIDGVYYPSQREGLRDLNDIAQIAVLKGPQGTLFGRNATGGVIQITTKTPSHTPHMEAGVSIDNYATIRSDAYVTGGLSPNIAASLSGSFVTQGDGWGRNTTTGKDTYKIDHIWSLRGKVLFEPGSDTTVTVIGDYMSRSDNMGIYYRSYENAKLLGTGWLPSGHVYDSVADLDPRNKFDGGGVSASIEHSFGFGKITSISAYRKSKAKYRFDNDATPDRIFHVISPKNDMETFTQEIQLTSPVKGNVNWALGVFYYNSKNSLDPISRFFGGPMAPLPTSFIRQDIHGAERTESIAPFAQLDFEILPDTRLTLGGRWTYEKRTFNGSITGFRNNAAGVPVSVIPPVVDASMSVKKPTWRIALDHQFSGDALGYISYNRGFKSGGFNIANPANQPYAPERLDAYEAGLKFELLDRKVRLNSAAFYYDYANIQVIQLIGGTQSISNGAKARLYGLDVDLEAKITDDLKLTGGVEFLHAKFTSYKDAAISAQNPNGGIIFSVGDATGNRLPLAQKFSGSIALDYSREFSFGGVNFNASWNHSGSYYFEADNVTRQKAYDMVNTQLGWSSLDSRFTISVFARNLLDKRIAAIAAATPTGYVASYSNPPRTYGVALRVSF